LVPELALVAGLTFFLIDEPNAATSALKSGRAWALMIAVGVAWIVARIVTFRFIPWRVAKLALFAVGAAAILAVVVVPAYDDDTVIEAFPGASLPSPPTTSAPPIPSSIGTTIASPTTTAAPVTSAPPGPVRVRVGQFRGIDHRASGTVAIYRQPDGRHVIGLEDFDIQPGPDYDLYVVPGADRERRDGGTRLDDLKGNRGTQYYEVPAGVDLANGTWSVLVWCQTFGVPVANATPV
jgi:hypothetical protein